MESCTSACSRNSLSCDPRDWRDDSSCTVLKHYNGGSCYACRMDPGSSTGEPFWGYNTYTHAIDCVYWSSDGA